jgi:hypothetical protein
MIDMPMDIERDDSIGIWTKHPELGKGDYKTGDEHYKIRPLTPEMMAHFDKQSQRPWKNPQTRAIETKRDDDIYNNLLYDHVLEDFRVLDMKGNPIPCTLDNKVKIAGKYSRRVAWIIDTAIEYGNDDEVRRKAEEEAFRSIREESPRPAVAELYGMPGPA